MVKNNLEFSISLNFFPGGESEREKEKKREREKRKEKREKRKEKERELKKLDQLGDVFKYKFTFYFDSSCSSFFETKRREGEKKATSVQCHSWTIHSSRSNWSEEFPFFFSSPITTKGSPQ